MDSDRRRPVLAAAAAASWLVGGIGYLTAEAVTAAAVRPPYSYAGDYISDLGVPGESPLAVVMNAAFCVQGSVFLLGAVSTIRAFRVPHAGVFLTCAALNAVGNVLVGTFHSGTTQLHTAGAVLAIVGGNAAVLAGRRAGGSRYHRAASLVLGGLGLASFAVLVLGVPPAGLWERAAVYSIIGWQLGTGLANLRPARRQHPQCAQRDRRGRGGA